MLVNFRVVMSSDSGVAYPHEISDFTDFRSAESELSNYRGAPDNCRVARVLNVMLIR